MIGFGKTSLDLTLTNRFLGVVGTGARWRLGRGEGLTVRGACQLKNGVFMVGSASVSG